MRVLIVGATGALGNANARLLSSELQVIGASRNGSDLSVGLADKASIVSMYQKPGTVDAVICAAGTAKFAPLESLSDEDFALSLGNKHEKRRKIARDLTHSSSPWNHCGRF
ncbi:dTDP-4-dehydrorhamnose reductase [Paraburkholderia sp. CI2]|uniref:hypothetical protein n=1 Tax=Paraburkholderia sp. CI2 TaxID=2723093 RepID=UPI00162286C1|nr:hypothetical protein [Paraburkholderia sp. CI2]MBB5465644.1 dTDP-4-dehydrorhamnose reductase [Paraburkholderia sp. CI2]